MVVLLIALLMKTLLQQTFLCDKLKICVLKFCGGLVTAGICIQEMLRLLSVLWVLLDTQAKMEYRLCAVCNDIRLVLSGVGLGMQSQARFAVVHMDDAKLSPELKLLTCFVSVMSIICICIGAVVYIPRKEVDSSSSSFHIFTGWVKETGCFRVLKSDSDPAYASQMGK